VVAKTTVVLNSGHSPWMGGEFMRRLAEACVLFMHSCGPESVHAQMPCPQCAVLACNLLWGVLRAGPCNPRRKTMCDMCSCICVRASRAGTTARDKTAAVPEDARGDMRILSSAT